MVLLLSMSDFLSQDLDALKKTKKNVRRTFSDADVSGDAEELYKLLSIKSLKTILTVSFFCFYRI